MFSNLLLSEKFAIRPGLEFASYSKDGESSNELFLPVLFKYKATEKFGLMFGPQFDYLLDGDSDGFNNFGLGIALGLEFDIAERFFLETRYSFGISERLENDDLFEGVEMDLRSNNFNLGVGYRF